MTGQPLDLRRSLHILRRHMAWVGILVAVGLLGGIGYVLMNPPMVTSNVLVAIPTSTRYPSAQLVTARSEPVLAIAGQHLRPALTPKALVGRVQVTGLTPYLLLIGGQGRTPSQAQAVAKAIADSYVAYLNSPDNPGAPVQAQILEGPTDATGFPAYLKLLIAAGIGVLAGTLVGVTTVLAIGRRDRRLRRRDQIADAIGVPVLASVPGRRPADAESWSRLLRDYQPGAAEACQFRSILKHLALIDVDAADTASPAASVTVVSLLSDRRALALGPQLAAFAASLGIPTALVVGPEQGTGSAEALLAACAAQPPWSGDSGQLRVIVANHDDADTPPEATLTIVVAVTDGQTARVSDTIPTTVTMLGVSAGAATSEELARVAVGLAVGGRNLAGLLVVDSNPADETTGRLPQLARPVEDIRPARMTGIAARG